MRNPFSPTAGFMPPQIVDRDRVLFDFETGLEDGPGAEERFMRVSGERGMGKTVLLQKMCAMAEERGWNTVLTEANEGCIDYIRDKLLSFISSPVASASLKLPVAEVTLAAEDATRVTLRRLLEIYYERGGAPLLLCVDEVQDSFTSEVREVVQGARARFGAGDEIAIVLAGLPDMIANARTARGLTFLHRAMGEDLGLLDLDRVRESYRQTFEEGGARVSMDALGLLAESTGGHPYLMQLLGRRLWRRWGGSPDPIGIEDVEAVLPEARRAFDDAVVDVVLGELTGRQRDYLEAVARRGGEASTREVAEDLGYTDADGSPATTKASAFRAALIQKGLLKPAGRGRVRLAVTLNWTRTPRSPSMSTQDTPAAPTGEDSGETPYDPSFEKAVLEDVRAWRAGKLETYSLEEVEEHLGLDR